MSYHSPKTWWSEQDEDTQRHLKILFGALIAGIPLALFLEVPWYLGMLGVLNAYMAVGAIIYLIAEIIEFVKKILGIDYQSKLNKEVERKIEQGLITVDDEKKGSSQ